MFLKTSVSSFRACNIFATRPLRTNLESYQITARNLSRTMASNTGPTLKQAIKDDHAEMYVYFDEYNKNSGDAAAQARWSRLFTWEIARHAVGEEIVVYPLMENHLGEKGKKLADNDRLDHQYVKERLYELEDLASGTPEHARQMQDIMDHLKPHNDSEENEDLPLLEEAIGTPGSIDAATSFQMTKKFVPTRSHPSAPDKPPYETLVSFLQAPIDKLQDYFATFPSSDEKQEAKKAGLDEFFQWLDAVIELPSEYSRAAMHNLTLEHDVIYEIHSSCVIGSMLYRKNKIENKILPLF